MNAQTRAQVTGKIFKQVAMRLAPQMNQDWDELVEDDMNAQEIDERIFRVSEYLGGMADIIIVVAAEELAKQGEAA